MQSSWHPAARWAVGISLLVFAGLALLLAWPGPLQALDDQVTGWLAVHRQPGLTRAMLLVSASHETVKLLGVAVLLAAWRVLRGDRAGAVALAVVPVAELLNLLLKQAFRRPRPLVAEPLVHLSTFSFPSGHAVAAAAFYSAMCLLVLLHARSRPLRGCAVVFATAMVLLVAFSRVYLGAHYLSDVLAGIAVGMACTAAWFSWAARRYVGES